VKRTLWLTTFGCGLLLMLLVSACSSNNDSLSTATTEATSAATMTATDDQVLAAVTTALETKNGWEAGAATVTLDTVEGAQFAKGGVTDPQGGGALWFAALIDGAWQIVWDGNGIVDCASLDPYPNFPNSLLPQCVDASGNLQTR
jgi:hypothetical protein